MKGRDKHMRRLRGLAGDEVIKTAGKVVYVGSDMIRSEAFRSISAGSVSGKGHVPSKPGEPPNRDTGVLQSHLENEMTGPVSAKVTSSAPYAGALEFSMDRPYMRPARDKMAPKIQKLFAQELGDMVRRSGK